MEQKVGMEDGTPFSYTATKALKPWHEFIFFLPITCAVRNIWWDSYCLCLPARQTERSHDQLLEIMGWETPPPCT